MTSRMTEVTEPYSHVQKAAAWVVHAVTASGVVLGLMALLALVDNNAKGCLLWLGAALLVDGVDGTLARKFSVKRVLPNFDGAILDLVIDYLTYVFIPAIFIYKFIPLPGPLELVAVAFILLSALYCFCNVNMKSNDNYFVGFPAVWNVVALYLYVLDLEPGVTFALITIFAVMTFTTAKFVHPFRVPHLMPMNIAMTAVWMVSSLMLVLRQPETPLVLMVPWVVSSAWFAGICAWRTVRDYTQSR